MLLLQPPHSRKSQRPARSTAAATASASRLFISDFAARKIVAAEASTIAQYSAAYAVFCAISVPGMCAPVRRRRHHIEVLEIRQQYDSQRRNALHRRRHRRRCAARAFL